MSQAAGQVNIFIFLLKIKFSPCMPINFVMQGKCIFLDISRPDHNSTLKNCLTGPMPDYLESYNISHKQILLDFSLTVVVRLFHQLRKVNQVLFIIW